MTAPRTRQEVIDTAFSALYIRKEMLRPNLSRADMRELAEAVIDLLIRSGDMREHTPVDKARHALQTATTIPNASIEFALEAIKNAGLKIVEDRDG